MILKRTAIYEELKAIVASYPEIFFVQGGVIGLAFLAVTFAVPSVGASGIIAVISAYAFARFLKMEREFLRSGFYTYNPLLVGLSLGNLFQLTPLTIFLIASAGILTFIVAIAMANLFSRYLALPILSVPFVIVSWCAYLASRNYGNLFRSENYGQISWLPEPDLPVWVAGYFKCFGAMLFAPNVWAGAIICALILSQSRILFLLSLLGYYIGAGTRGLMFGNFDPAFANINNFNFILIAMAVGGVYVVPSISTYVLASIAVIISTLVFDSVSNVCFYVLHIPAFTLPFNLVSLAFLYLLALLQSPLCARFIGRTPEETVDIESASRKRYVGQLRTLFLPFSGVWKVWQGFSGKWTHQGAWKYAYDFVIADDDGKTHAGDGSKLDDYLCFRKPVLSPVRGRVVQVIDDLPDCAIGSPDRANNWGNLVVIQDYRGFFVEISHLLEKSARVKVGDSVERGMILGLCGNSGYSPQPHIHVQVQATECVGGATLPFSFVSYADGEYHANDCPREGSLVEPLYSDKRLENLTSFTLDEQYDYAVLRNGREIERLKLIVKMAPDGTFYFDSGRGRLYFGKHEGTFYFYRAEGADRWLRLMLLALPRLPLVYRARMTWRDYVSVGAAASGLRKIAAQFLSSFYSALATVPAIVSFIDRNQSETVLKAAPFCTEKRATVELDDRKGFHIFKSDDIEIRRINREDN
ncbi:MAG TPA: urea transporter [Planctomycetota bacterium]|nr:urea transporter [Planctomycetota bacterium]